jgi:hypothetical protein
MSSLSPYAAQAVMDAYWATPNEPITTQIHQAAVAAALRAAVDQVISPDHPPCEDFDEYAQGFLAAHIQYRAEFLAIAAELEALPE